MTVSEKEEFCRIARGVIDSARYRQMKTYLAHTDVTVFEHSLRVAYTAYRMAAAWNIACDREALVRGALLHDYYLYDWHDPKKGFRWHGLKHHRFALANADDDFPLTAKERRIIYTHMFPLTFWTPPTCREAWLVTLADKMVAGVETLKKYR